MTGKTDSEKDSGDYLGYSVYAETLWARIQAALDKDLVTGRALGDDPLVVGIFGEWGAGKSTLLKQIFDLAADVEAQRSRNRSGAGGGFGDPGFGLTVPVLFQPWKYEHEPHLLVPLLLHIIQALRDSIPKAQTIPEKAGQAAARVWAASIGALPDLVKGFEQIYKATVADFAMVDPATTAGASVGFKTAGWLAKWLKRPDDADWLRDFKFSSEGRFYYNSHNVMLTLTRPGKRAEAIGALKFDPTARINFVIFIDDLDRCLPEKAVETLELIKTVFNLESFAFVLALDEEVVERGIGHRYKDYALQNKKPEMPITGFEYLEKIVHLPFRLPGLTRDQARQLLERYEREEVAPNQPERWWFSPRPAVEADKEPQLEEIPKRVSDRSEAANADLSNLVLSAFTTYVPRKLIRLIELLHQVQEVALRRGKRLTVGVDSGADVRVMSALLMIQLFQPDLYRLMRRKLQALPFLLAAFATRSNGYREFSDPDISDVDLWLWVVEESAGKGNDWIQTCSISEAMNAVVQRISKRYHVFTDHGLPVQYQAHNEDGEEQTVTEFDIVKTRQKRSLSQNVKLPLVAHIVEHRAAQRHAFDPLRLMHALAGSLEADRSAKDSDGVSSAASLEIAPYFSLMVPGDDPHWELYFGPATSSDPNKDRDNARTFPDIADTASGSARLTIRASGRGVDTQLVRFPDRLFADLVSDQTEVQANLFANNELEPGKVLETAAAQALLQRLQAWKQSRETPEASTLLARGLLVIAPLLPRELGAAFLALVDDPAAPPWLINAGQRFVSKEALHQAVKRTEFWSALGQDERFDPGRFYLPRKRLASNELNTEREPIPGFVRVFENKQEIFQPFDGPSVILKPYYMARHLTTVDQFACFVDAGGYGEPGGAKPDWWDKLGWAWRTGEWDSTVTEDVYRGFLEQREPALRGVPINWEKQRPFGNCPVTSLNWFEARAYARWLELKLEDVLEGLPGSCSVRLPTEAQWERATRAKDFRMADSRQYPWGGTDDQMAHLHANVRASGIDRVSPVGLFAPNPLGLFDLCGNVWEWQNNLYLPNGSGQDQGVEQDVAQLSTQDDWTQCDLLAMRGGAWFDIASAARASFRHRTRPVSWNNFVGFRVVLSQVEKDTDI